MMSDHNTLEDRGLEVCLFKIQINITLRRVVFN